MISKVFKKKTFFVIFFLNKTTKKKKNNKILLVIIHNNYLKRFCYLYFKKFISNHLHLFNLFISEYLERDRDFSLFLNSYMKIPLIYYLLNQIYT